MIPLEDESRRPSRFPIVTAFIIGLNGVAFLLELMNGDAFVTQWSAVPADIVAGHHLITILTAMFMHASWSHILGNMVFLWAFGPEIEDAMNPWRYMAFYVAGGIVAMLAQVAADPGSTIPNLGASGAIAAVMGAFLVTYPHDKIRTVLLIGWFVRITFVPAALLIGFWFFVQLLSFGVIADVQSGGVAYMAHIAGLIFWSRHRTFRRGPAAAHLISAPGGHFSDKPADLPPICVPAFWPIATAAVIIERGLDLYARNLEFVAEEIKLRGLQAALATPNRSRLELHTMFLQNTESPMGFPTLVDAPYAGHTAMIAD